MEQLLPLAQAIGVALLHSSWIALLGYALVRTIAPLLPASTAKYYLAYGMLWLITGAIIYAGYTAYIPPVVRIDGAELLGDPTALNSLLAELLATTPTGAASWTEALMPYTPYLALLYLTGLLPSCYLLRRNHLQIKSLQRTGLHSLPGSWQPLIAEVRDQFPAWKNVAVYLSDRATEVMALGFSAPIILFPQVLASELTPAMVRSLLLHEIAHLRHYDHWLNYPQQAIRALLFYHPAVHALSRYVDELREHRCDDFVAQQTNDRPTYATALVAAARFQTLHQPNPLAMSANKTPFTSRIHRLFGPEKTPTATPYMLPAVLALVLGVCQLSFTDKVGEVAGAEPVVEEQRTVEPAPEPTIPPVATDLAIAEVAPSPAAGEVPTTAPATVAKVALPGLRGSPSTHDAAPAASPIVTDTIDPAALPQPITDENRQSLHVPLTGGQVTVRYDKPVSSERSAMRLNGELVDITKYDELVGDKLEFVNVIRDRASLDGLGLQEYDVLLDVTVKPTAEQSRTQEIANLYYLNGRQITLQEWRTAGPLEVTMRKIEDPIEISRHEVGAPKMIIQYFGTPQTDEPAAEQDKIAIFIDGVLHDNFYKDEISKLVDPSDIESIDVVKGNALIQAGLQGYDGAIYITTKNKRKARKARKANRQPEN